MKKLVSITVLALLAAMIIFVAGMIRAKRMHPGSADDGSWFFSGRYAPALYPAVARTSW